MKFRLSAIVLIILGAYLGFFIFNSETNPDSRFPFRYGLDLDGGTHLTYGADTSALQAGDVDGAMNALRETVERRVNIFGVSEPIVHIERGSVFSGDKEENRLIVELPGVTDVTEAIDAIGKTPTLEFKLPTTTPDIFSSLTASSTPEEVAALLQRSYAPTGLTGAYLKRASLVFDNINGQPVVSVEFNSEGTKLFAEITKANIGRPVAIFLDGVAISEPVVQQAITNGSAQITGNFTIPEAQTLVRDLNFGALPLPIELISTQTIGPSLGHATLEQGVRAMLWAFALIFIFLILLYRLPGLIASVALCIYGIIMLSLFKLIPVTLTSSGIAGFILSLGMAVDANILIFERMKEEMAGKSELKDAVINGFKRAWLSIRDGNLSSIISAVVLYWLSGTSLIKGFALVFGIGVLVSMLTAIIITRTFLLALTTERTPRWLFKPTFSKVLNKEK